jgi:hypothetical protein
MRPNSPHTRRLLAMVWFSASAMLALALFFYPISMTANAQFLFIALPGISGAVAGYAFGGNIIDRTKTAGYGKAILKGAGVALGAFVIFAGLFAVCLPLIEPRWGLDQVGGLFVSALIFGSLMGGPLAVIAGGIAGASLHGVGARMRA